MNKKTNIIRIPNSFSNKIDNAMFERFKNGLVNKKEFSRTEGFRLLERIPEFNFALDKLKTLPKKEDINK